MEGGACTETVTVVVGGRTFALSLSPKETICASCLLSVVVVVGGAKKFFKMFDKMFPRLYSVAVVCVLALCSFSSPRSMAVVDGAVVIVVRGSKATADGAGADVPVGGAGVGLVGGRETTAVAGVGGGADVAVGGAGVALVGGKQTTAVAAVGAGADVAVGGAGAGVAVNTNGAVGRGRVQGGAGADDGAGAVEKRNGAVTAALGRGGCRGGGGADLDGRFGVGGTRLGAAKCVGVVIVVVVAPVFVIAEVSRGIAVIGLNKKGAGFAGAAVKGGGRGGAGAGPKDSRTGGGGGLLAWRGRESLLWTKRPRFLLFKRSATFSVGPVATVPAFGTAVLVGLSLKRTIGNILKQQ